MTKIADGPPIAFIAPVNRRYVLWASSPAGHMMLLEGSWAFEETARLFATRCGYNLITTEEGMVIVEQQMNSRTAAIERQRRPSVH